MPEPTDVPTAHAAGEDYTTRDERIPTMALADWGLLPPRGAAPVGLTALAQWWFIRFNPLYFFSAFCILAGVALVTSASGGDLTTELALFAAVEGYQLTVIGAGALLVRGFGALRPGVLLLLLETVFLFDCTFRLETIARFPQLGVWVTAGWVALTGCKLLAMASAVRLQVGAAPFLAAWAAAGTMALMVQLLSLPAGVLAVDDELSVLQATGLIGLALVLVAVKGGASVSTPLAETALQHIFLARLLRAVLALLTIFFFYHLVNYSAWIYVHPPRAFIVHGATAALAVMLRRRNESTLWWCALVICGAAGFNPQTFTVVIAALTVLLAYKTWREGHHRLAIAAVAALHLTLWSYGAAPGEALPPWPGVVSVAALLPAAMLVLVGWRLKVWLAWVPLAIGAVYQLSRLDWTWSGRAFEWLMRHLPRTPLGLGVSLLVAGFIALIVGLVINWRLRRVILPEPSALATTTRPPQAE